MTAYTNKVNGVFLKSEMVLSESKRASCEKAAVNIFVDSDETSVVRTVLASFPLCDITEEDLTQNPQFCKLLATLSQHVDRTGLTGPLKTELDKVPADTTRDGAAFSRAVFHNCFLQRFL